MLHSDFISQSDARRLTDCLRAASEHSRPHARNGSVNEQAFTLNIVLNGGVLRQRVLSNGRVHTVAVYFRDDVINLALYASGKMRGTDYLLALEGAVIGSVPYHVVAIIQAAATDKRDGMGALMAREIGIAHERLTSLGQRSAVEAMAHFFCEAFVRCADPVSTANWRPFRMTQQTLSTVLGISAVHVNRTFQQLRRLELVDIVDNHLVVRDYKSLTSLADFDDTYLSAI
jgi:CRP-like cAMP-binding protein